MFCDSVFPHMCLLMRIKLCYHFLHKHVLCTFWWAHWWCSHGRATRGFAQVFADVGQQFVLWSIRLVWTFPSIKKCKVQRNRLIIYDAGLLAAPLPLVGWSALFPVELCAGRVQVWCVLFDGIGLNDVRCLQRTCTNECCYNMLLDLSTFHAYGSKGIIEIFMCSANVLG